MFNIEYLILYLEFFSKTIFSGNSSVNSSLSLQISLKVLFKNTSLLDFKVRSKLSKVKVKFTLKVYYVINKQINDISTFT